MVEEKEKTSYLDEKVTKPDIDNLMKTVYLSSNYLWKDDNQIAEYDGKRYWN